MRMRFSVHTGREAALVGGDVVDGVGCGFRGADLHRAHFNVVDVGLDAEVEVCLWARRAG